MHFNSDCFLMISLFVLFTRAVWSYFPKRFTVIFLSCATDYRNVNCHHWKWQVSNLNTCLKSALSKSPQVSFISCLVCGWIKTDTAQHSVTSIFHPDCHSWEWWHTNGVAPGKWHQPEFTESLEPCLKLVGHSCLSTEGNLSSCAEWGRTDASPRCHCSCSLWKHCLTQLLLPSDPYYTYFLKGWYPVQLLLWKWDRATEAEEGGKVLCCIQITLSWSWHCLGRKH